MIFETIDPEELQSYSPDYEKDTDFESYLYIYDSDVIEEELIFEELLKKERVEQEEIIQEEVDNKKHKVRELMKYAEDKFKTEKEHSTVMSKIKEGRKNLKKGFLKIIGGEKHEGEESPEKKGQSKDKDRAHPIIKELKRLETVAATHRHSIYIGRRKHVFSGSNEYERLISTNHQRERRPSMDLTLSDYDAVQSKLNFFRRVIFPKAYKKLAETTKKMLKEHYDELIALRDSMKEKEQQSHDRASTFKNMLVKKGLGPWDILWRNKSESIKVGSPYQHFPSYRLRQVIVKGGDDLRQEIIIMQVIKKIQEAFENEGTGLFVKTYEIIVTSKSSGILEFIPDSISIDGLKKKYTGMGLLEIYKTMFGYAFEEAQKNFVESLAGYSIVTYILQVKDRHNGNILINSDGHLVHIDFGFVLTTAPGGINFESAPFKITADYMKLMGGPHSAMFAYFKILLIQGFLAIRKYIDEISDILEIMSMESKLPCFEKFDIRTFRDRFKISLTDEERTKHVEYLVKESMNSKRTGWYDEFQKMTNGIHP